MKYRPLGSGRSLLRPLVLALPFLFALSGLVKGQLNLTPKVNPFIGTDAGGNVFPGAVYPWGMMQWSPDTTNNPGGYDYPDSVINGFSLTHFSGRGIKCYQDIQFMPTIGPLASSPGTNWSSYSSSFSHTNESASPGYYSVNLAAHNIRTELTVTQRTGMGRFTFPASTQATMLINLASSWSGVTSGGTHVDIVSPNTVTGYATTSAQVVNYKIYFAAQFDQSFTSSGTWNGGTLSAGSTSASGSQIGAYLVFNTTSNQVVQAKVAISYVSVANAQANLSAENTGWSFGTTQGNANTAWNNQLNSIQVQGGTSNEQTVFYTALYHSMIHPTTYSDVNGQYLAFDKQIHTATAGHVEYHNISSWDMYRTLFPLISIINPAQMSDMIQSLVNDGKHDSGGGMPRWNQVNGNSGIMTGDGQDILIAWPYAFGAQNFDTANALSAMERGADVTTTKSGGQLVREGLSEYLNLGYVATDTGIHSASETLEYESDDFALAQFAKSLGNNADYIKYLTRAQNWIKLFSPANGNYIVPRNSDGTFITNFTPDGGGSGFNEGTSAIYTWMIPMDMRELFDQMGGNATAISRLDTHFSQLNNDNSLYAYMGNEPDSASPYSYLWAGAPYRTQDVVRKALLQLYNTSSTGIPGNDDGGAMGSWVVWAGAGIRPAIPGVAGFVVGSPLFTSVTFRLASGTLQINAPAASDANEYLQSLTLNGSAYNSSWIPWSSVSSGGTLNFTLGSTANTSWASTPSQCPPSYDFTRETESLEVQSANGATHRVITDSNFSAGAGTILDAVAVGNSVVYVAPYVTAGTYDITVRVKTLNTRGTWQLAIGQAGNNSPVNVGTPQDEYASAAGYRTFDLGTWSPATTGTKWFWFTVTGKNASSSGYSIAFDYIKLTPQ